MNYVSTQKLNPTQVSESSKLTRHHSAVHAATLLQAVIEQGAVFTDVQYCNVEVLVCCALMSTDTEYLLPHYHNVAFPQAAEQHSPQRDDPTEGKSDNISIFELRLQFISICIWRFWAFGGDKCVHHVWAYSSLLSSLDGEKCKYEFLCGYHGCVRALASRSSAVKEIAARLSVHMCWRPDCWKTSVYLYEQLCVFLVCRRRHIGPKAAKLPA